MHLKSWRGDSPGSLEAMERPRFRPVAAHTEREDGALEAMERGDGEDSRGSLEAMERGDGPSSLEVIERGDTLGSRDP